MNARRKNPGFVTPPPPKRNLPEILRAEGAEVGRVAQLLREGIDPNGRDQSADTGLHYAAREPDPDVVRLLLSSGARCDPRNKDGNTPLHVAAGTGSTPPFSDAEAVETVRLLLECGARPNRRNNDGDTPLHTAFTGVPLFSLGKGDSGVVGALLRGGAKPNTKNNDGDAPLMLAVKESDAHAKTVRVLLEHGASPDTRNRKGSSALHVAAEEKHPSMIAALLAAGAEPDARDKQGDTALIIAAKKRNKNAEEIEALLKGGADPCLKDREGYLPYHHEARNSRGWHLLDRARGFDSACGQKAVAEAPTREEPKREVTEPKQREQLTPKCREYLASVDRLFELQRRYALATYDGGETYSFTSGMQAEYERLEAIATSLGADFQTAFSAAQNVWIEKGAGSTAAEAKSKTQGAIDASRATFLKEGGVCQS